LLVSTDMCSLLVGVATVVNAQVRVKEVIYI